MATDLKVNTNVLENFDSSRVEEWLELCNSTDDFHLVINKEILQNMLAAFTTKINEDTKKYYWEEMNKRIDAYDKLYAEMDKKRPNENSVREQTRMEKVFNERFQKDAAELQQQIEALEYELKKKPKELEEHVSAEDAEFYINKLQQDIAVLQNEKQEYEANTDPLIQKHNNLIPEYNRVFVQYNKLRERVYQLPEFKQE
ncbi:hypothetical protein EIN_084950 [Entamoeba invadens IP1]|uniref:hypothetical protein n=1 Tax=Entamoeba invadens IP1 TaxID=370355 RepID=UPI0002C3D19F|nr:hypothetical protein EIN_084950 [Entamoeba invadens IP1]ELP85283.1 hypothetical protein EIN_084950 [Entamoeba invadens IP1]|eukprot:XP_004184629.1 hypothetical protein EIN_084950 [Entamoeba invadens IP1]